MPPHLLSQQLQLLPPSLETLELDFANASKSLLAYAPNWPEQEPFFLETAHPLGAHIFLDLPRLFPRLTKLHVNGGNDFASTRTSTSLFALPPTLTDLSLLFLTLYEGDIPHLPQGLLRLSVKSIELNACRDACLPPNLTLISGISQPLAKHAFKLLPRSLTDDVPVPRWNLEIARAIPPRLQNLTLPFIDLESFSAAKTTWCSLLPYHLTTLNVQHLLTFTPFEIASLPETLTSLLIWKISQDFFDEQVIEPTEISPSLHRPKSEVLTPSESLCLNVPGYWEETWPPKLLTLHLLGGSDFSLLDTFDVLPASITCLELASVPSFDNPDDPTILYLPKLTSLIIDRDFSDFRTIPSTLTKLSVIAHASLKTSRIAPFLHQGLVELTLDCGRLDWFEQLPRGLTALSFIYSSLGYVPSPEKNDIFSTLPDGLERLSVSL